MTRPFRFSIQAFSSPTRKEWVDLAQKVEASGFSALHVADHYLGPGSMIEGTGHRVQAMALIPAMTAAAMVTSTLRIGSRMACVSYHLPTILTKEMATIDVLSEGRLEVGLGAGWLEREYEASGWQSTCRSTASRVSPYLRSRLPIFREAFIPVVFYE